ncbi:hypothetical protein HD554DRAFT_1433527 [Boletus coccyginus]|nr:hypothetical protein HD554DRAFT_1433527 [Boletus coccyginus]
MFLGLCCRSQLRMVLRQPSSPHLTCIEFHSGEDISLANDQAKRELHMLVRPAFGSVVVSRNTFSRFGDLRRKQNWHLKDRRLTKDATVEHPSGNRAPPPAKKRQRKDTAAPKKRRRRGKPGEICQLNLDMLFLVREILFCSCFNRFPTDAMVVHTYEFDKRPTCHVPL